MYTKYFLEVLSCLMLLWLLLLFILVVVVVLSWEAQGQGDRRLQGSSEEQRHRGSR